MPDTSVFFLETTIRDPKHDHNRLIAMSDSEGQDVSVRITDEDFWAKCERGDWAPSLNDRLVGSATFIDGVWVMDAVEELQSAQLATYWL